MHAHTLRHWKSIAHYRDLLKPCLTHKSRSHVRKRNLYSYMCMSKFCISYNWNCINVLTRRMCNTWALCLHVSYIFWFWQPIIYHRVTTKIIVTKDQLCAELELKYVSRHLVYKSLTSINKSHITHACYSSPRSCREYHTSYLAAIYLSRVLWIKSTYLFLHQLLLNFPRQLLILCHLCSTLFK